MTQVHIGPDVVQVEFDATGMTDAGIQQTLSRVLSHVQTHELPQHPDGILMIDACRGIKVTVDERRARCTAPLELIKVQCRPGPSTCMAHDPAYEGLAKTLEQAAAKDFTV